MVAGFARISVQGGTNGTKFSDQCGCDFGGIVYLGKDEKSLQDLSAPNSRRRFW